MSKDRVDLSARELGRLADSVFVLWFAVSLVLVPSTFHLCPKGLVRKSRFPDMTRPHRTINHRTETKQFVLFSSDRSLNLQL